MFAVQLHAADKAVFEGIMLALEGELLRDLDRAQFRQGFRWWQCVFRKNATIKLTFGRLAEFLYSIFFLSFLVTIGAFFKKMPVSSQPMMDWQGVFFKGACFPSLAGGF
jgi:hypothetical protein